MAEILFGVFCLHPRQRGLPVHALAAVGLRPHQAGGAVGDGAVAVVVEIVFAVVRVAADADRKERLVPPAGHRRAVSFDAAVGKIDSKHLVRVGHIQGAGGPLRINGAFAGAGIAVSELEILRVNERRQSGSVRTGTGIYAAENDERVEFLDRRQPPVVEPAELRGIEFGRQRPGLFQRQLVAAVRRAVAVGIRAALPCQPGDIVAEPSGHRR